MASYRITMACKLKIKDPYIASFIEKDEFESFQDFKEAIQNSIVEKSLFPSKTSDGSVSLMSVEVEGSNVKVGTETFDSISLVSLFLTKFSNDENTIKKTIETRIASIEESSSIEEEDFKFLKSLTNFTGTSSFSSINLQVDKLIDDYSKQNKPTDSPPEEQPQEDDMFYLYTTRTEIKSDDPDIYTVADRIAVARQVFLRSLDPLVITVDGKSVDRNQVFLKVEKDSIDYIQAEGVTEDRLANVAIFYVLKDGKYQQLYIKGNKFSLKSNVEFTTDPNKAFTVGEKVQLQFWFPNLENEIYETRRRISPEAKEAIVSFKRSPDNKYHAFDIIRKFPSTLSRRTLKDFLQGRTGKLEVVEEEKGRLRKGQIVLSIDGEKIPFYTRKLHSSYQSEVKELITYALNESTSADERKRIADYLKTLFLANDYTFYTTTAGDFFIKSAVSLEESKIVRKPENAKVKVRPEVFFELLNKSKSEARISKDLLNEGAMFTRLIIKDGKLAEEQMLAEKWLDDHLSTPYVQFKSEGELVVSPEYSAVITFSKTTGDIIPPLNEVITVGSLLDKINKSDLSEASLLLYSLMEKADLLSSIRNNEVRFANYSAVVDGVVYLKDGTSVDTLLHEVVHLLTSNWINENQSSSQVNTLAEIAKKVGIEYGDSPSNSTLAKELLANLSNQEVVNGLKSIKSDKKTLLAQLSDVLKGIFKFVFSSDYTETLYDEVVINFLSISAGKELNYGEVNPVSGTPARRRIPGGQNMKNLNIDGATVEDQILAFKDQIEKTEGALYLDSMIRSIEGDLASLLAKDMLALLSGQLNYNEVFENLYTTYYYQRTDKDGNLITNSPTVDKFIDLFLDNEAIIKEIFFRENKVFTFTKVKTDTVKMVIEDTVESVETTLTDTDSPVEEPGFVEEVAEDEDSEADNDVKEANKAALEESVKKEKEFGRDGNTYNFEEADKEVRYLIKMLPAIEMEEGKPKIYTLEQRNQAIKSDLSLGTQLFFKIPGKERLFIRVDKDANGSVRLTDHTETWNRLSYMFTDKMNIEEMLFDTFRNDATLEIVPEFYALYSWLVKPAEHGDELNDTEDNLHIYTSFEKSFKRFNNPLSKTLDDNGILSTVEEGADVSIITDRLVNDRFRQFVLDQAFAFYNADNDTFDLEGFLNSKRGSLIDEKKSASSTEAVADYVLEILGFEFSKKVDSGSVQTFRDAVMNFIRRTGRVNDLPLDIARFIRNDYVPPKEVVLKDAKGNVLKKVDGLNSRYKFIHQLQHKVSPYTFSPIVKNAEGENQSINSIPNSILYEAAVYSRDSLAEVQEKIPRAKNPMFERSLFRKKLFDSEGNKKPGVTIKVGNYSGVAIVQEGQASQGALNVNLTERQKVLADFHNFLTKGECENTRAQVASTSYYIKIVETIGSNLLFNIDVSREAYEGPVEGNAFYEAVYNYLEGELAEIEGLPDNQRELFLFNSKMISEDLRRAILKEGPRVHKAKFLQEIHATFLKDMQEFRALFLRNGGARLVTPGGEIRNSIIMEVERLRKDYATSDDPQTALGKAQDVMFFHFIANKFAFYVEETILFQGSLRKLSNKDYFKRANTVQSTKYPPTASPKLRQRINDRLKQSSVATALRAKPFELKDTYLSATKSDYEIVARDLEGLKRGFKESMRLFYAASGVENYEAKVEYEAETLLKKYEKVTVQDGSGTINPDAYIALLLSLGAKPNMFKAYRALMLDMIYNRHLYFKDEIEAGVLPQEFVDTSLTPEEIQEMEEGLKMIEEEKIIFPSLKWSYRGGVVRQDPNQKVADEALDKFSLFPLFIQYVYDKPVLKAELIGMINQGLAYVKVKSGTKIFQPDKGNLTDVNNNRTNQGFEIDFTSSTHELLTSNLGEQINTPTVAKTRNTFGSQVRKLILSGLAHLDLGQIKTALKNWDVANQELSSALENEVLKEFGIQNRNFENVDIKNIARVLRLHAQKREMTKNVMSFLEGVESGKYTDFSHSFNKREIENLISNIVKRIAVQKLTGSQLIQVASSQDDDLAFYSLQNGIVTEAECKVTMMGDFLNLLNLPEVKKELENEKQVNIITKVRAINRLLKDPAFRQKYKEELTIVTYRIPTQGYNSMDVFVIKEFLPTFQGPQIILPPEAVVKSGTDYDYDKAPSIFPVIGKDGKIIKGKVPTESLKELKDLKKQLEGKLAPLFEARLELKNFFKKIQDLEENIDDLDINFLDLAQLVADSALLEIQLKENIKNLQDQNRKTFKQYLEVKRNIFLKRNPSALHQNELLATAKFLLTHPANFFKLITPNSDAIIMKEIDTAFDTMGIDTTSPTGSDITRYSTNFRKWKIVKFGDLLGIAATSNTLITLLQRYGAKFNTSFNIEYRRKKGYFKSNIHFGLLTEQERDSILKDGQIDVSNPFDHDGVLRQEVVAQLINVTVDLPGNDKFGFSNFSIDNFGAALYLIMVQGVPFGRIVNLFHQPVIYQYHSLLDEYANTISPYNKRKYTKREARLLTIYRLLGAPVPVEIKEDESEQINFNQMERSVHKRMEESKRLVNPNMLPELTNISEVYTAPINQTQKYLLIYYLSVLLEGEAVRKLNSLINFDRVPDNLVIKTLNRELTESEVIKENFISPEFIGIINDNSVISGLNIKEVLTNLSKSMFPALYSDITLGNFKVLLNKVTAKDAFYNKVTNDFLSSIVQTFGLINYEGRDIFIKALADDFLIGDRKYELVKYAKKANDILKAEGKSMRLLSIMVNSVSRKTTGSAKGDKKINNIQIVMGFENSGEDKNRLIEEFRQLLNHPNERTRKFATALAAVGIIQSGYSKSPIFFSDIIPEEFISPLIMNAIKTYLALSPGIQSNFMSQFITRFEQVEGALFNNYRYKESYRYKNYRLLDLTENQVKEYQPKEYTEYEDVETVPVEVQPGVTISPEDITLVSGKSEFKILTEGNKREEVVSGYKLEIKNQPDVELFVYNIKGQGWPVTDNKTGRMFPIHNTFNKLVDKKDNISQYLSDSINYYAEKESTKKPLEDIGFNFSQVISSQTSPTNLETDENLPCAPF